MLPESPEALSKITIFSFISKKMLFLPLVTDTKGTSMKIVLLTVGKTDKDWVKMGLDIYVSRLRHYVPFSISEIPELKNVSSLSKEQIKAKEGELILKSLKKWFWNSRATGRNCRIRLL